MGGNEGMSAPKSKAELLDELETGRKAWESTLARITPDDLRVQGVEGSWSVRDVLAHICAYQLYMVAMLRDMKDPHAQATAMLDAYYQTNLTVYRAQHPELPENLEEVRGEQVNQVFVAAYRFKLGKEVLALEADAYAKLRSAIEEMSDEELSQPFMGGKSSLLQLIPKQSYGHYYQHIPAIQRWVERRKNEA